MPYSSGDELKENDDERSSDHMGGKIMNKINAELVSSHWRRM